MSDTECEWCKPYVSSEAFYQAERHSDMHVKYAALKASHAELMEALKTYRNEHDSIVKQESALPPCFCSICEDARAVLKKAEEALR